MSAHQWAFVRGLASAFLAGDWSRNPLLARGADATAADGLWLRAVVQDVLAAFPSPPHDRRDAVARFILRHDDFQAVWRNRALTPGLRRWYLDRPAMAPARWPVKRLDNLAEVGTWLGLPDGDLDWLADRKGWEHRTSETRMQNYSYSWVAKRGMGSRLLEAPKSRLKRAQRRILDEVLYAIPAHEAAHGFRPGRSVLTHARLHLGQPVVIRFDLRAYFTHVHPARAYGVFRALGYPEEVAKTLIGLCTNRVPLSVLSAAPAPETGDEAHDLFHLKRRLSEHHLPQGAPTSPALANLTSYGLDVRLTGLARSVGATYSRYADDLTFSGDRSLTGAGGRLGRFVGEIARDEGFALNAGKTRVMRASRRQSVTGVVVNTGLNVARDEVDRLKATLHNCLRTGPAAQARGKPEFKAHLQGRVAWVEYLNPRRGGKLRAMLDKVRWD